MVRARVRNGQFLPDLLIAIGENWRFYSKISGTRGRVTRVVPPTILVIEKTTMNDLSCGIRMWVFFISFFRFVTMHAFDRRTDRKAFAIPCSCTVSGNRSVQHSIFAHL